MPEALRIKGEILAQSNPSELKSVEDNFTRARLRRSTRCAVVGTASRDEFSAIVGSARRSADADALLRPIYARFTEGFETADLRAARTLLDQFT